MKGGPRWFALGLLLLGTTPLAAQLDSAWSRGLPLDKGRMRQDDIAMEWNRGTLAIRFVPLEERVVRLLAPDAAQSLHTLMQTSRARIDSIATAQGLPEVGVALVTFHALSPGTRFDPMLLTLSVRGQLWRAIGTVPLSVAFGNDQLDVRSAAVGLVIFDHLIPVREPFTVGYAESKSGDWGLRLTRLEAERARILATIRPVADSGNRR